MIRFSILLFGLLFVRTIKAQNLSPTVINSSGGTIQNSSYSLEWALGELAISTLNSPNNLLTQGFIQPIVSIVGVYEHFDKDRFYAFPNPVSDELNFRTDISDISIIWIQDFSGRLVFKTCFRESINLQSLNNGVYTVSLFNSQNQFLYGFKIIKI